MEIKWLGHSCFQISHEGHSVVLDPYNPDMIPGLGALHVRANQVLCSHEHDDHNYRKAVLLENTSTPNPFTVERIASFHDAVYGAKRGENYLTILSAGGLRIAHLGDIGCALSKEQEEKLYGLGAVMIPIGGHFTIGPEDAKLLCDRIRPKVIIPMHYRGKTFGFSTLGTLDAFTILFHLTKINQYDIDTILINATTQKQIALLKFK